MNTSPMKTIRLTADGPELPLLIYGCWRLADDPQGRDAHRIQKKIEGCLELGIHAFDHADIYGDYRCEKLFGEVLRRSPALREQMVLISKCDIALVSPQRPEHRVKHYDTRPEHIEASVERSLANLGTETLDLLLLHRPDPLMDARATAATLDRLVAAGKVKWVGVSNFQRSQVELLRAFLKAPLICNQIELSLLQTRPLIDGTLDHCQQSGIHPMAWSPLGGGRLFDQTNPQAARIVGALRSLATERGMPANDESLTQLALAWILSLPARPSVVIGSNRLKRIRSAVQAAAVELDRQSWFALYEASLGHEVP